MLRDQRNPGATRYAMTMFVLFVLSGVFSVNCGNKTVATESGIESNGDGGSSRDGEALDGEQTSGENDQTDAGNEPNAPGPDVPTGGEPSQDRGGGTETAPDAGEPVPEVPESSPIPDGPPGNGAFKVTRLIIRKGQEDGFDLDGDGKKDNQFGAIFNAESLQIRIAGTVIQSNIDNQILNEQLILLVKLSDLTDPTAQNGTATVNLFMGEKGANPGEYKINKAQSYDTNGDPYVEYKNVPIKNGIAETPAANLTLFLPLVPGSAPIQADLKLTKMRFWIEPMLRVLRQGIIGGVIPAETLNQDSGLGNTILEILVQEAPKEGQPDIDIDGDGKETFAYQNNALVCKDGDGKDVPVPTICPKRPCSCVQDGKIADGYSAVFSFEATAVTIVP